MPGQDLFQYHDADGNLRNIGSGDVNDYLAEAAGARFTAKDFRTWHGTVQALELTRLACGAASSPRLDAKGVIAEVARRLDNTAAICRKAYIHPAVLELGRRLAADETAIESVWSRSGAARRKSRGLRAAEWRLLKFLERRCQVRSEP